MKIYQSAEDYLEAILVLDKRLGFVRSIDIVNELGVSKPSVSVAMKKLRESGYIFMDGSGHITLSDTGLEIASKVEERHEVLTELLVGLGVSREIALADACKVEHNLSDESFYALREFVITKRENND